MKLDTALRYAKTLHDRLVETGGVIDTLYYSNSSFTFEKAFVFGSTIRGKHNPNDLDVIYVGKASGTPASQQFPSKDWVWDFSKVKRDSRVDYLPAECEVRACSILRKGMKMVSLHPVSDVSVEFGNMVEIFPRFNLDMEDPTKSEMIHKDKAGLPFPERTIFMVKFAHKWKMARRLKIKNQYGIVNQVIDRFCRIHKKRMTMDESWSLVNAMYSRYDFHNNHRHKYPGLLYGSGIRILFPFNAHPDNLKQDNS